MCGNQSVLIRIVWSALTEFIVRAKYKNPFQIVLRQSLKYSRTEMTLVCGRFVVR